MVWFSISIRPAAGAPGNLRRHFRLTQPPNGASLESSVGALQYRYGASVPWKQYLTFMQVRYSNMDRVPIIRTDRPRDHREGFPFRALATMRSSAC